MEVIHVSITFISIIENYDQLWTEKDKTTFLVSVILPTAWNGHTVERRYNAVQYGKILHK